MRNALPYFWIICFATSPLLAQAQVPEDVSKALVILMPLAIPPNEKEGKMPSASTVVRQSTRRKIRIFSWDPQFNRVDYHGITFPVTPDDN